MTDQPAISLDTIVARYVELRDEKTRLAAEHAAVLKPLSDKMGTIEQWLLAHCNQTGVEAVRTEHGTAYKSTVMGATVEDWGTLLSTTVGAALRRALDLIEQGQPEQEVIDAFTAAPEFNFLIRGVNKTAVEEYMAASEGRAPPGVKTTFITKVNVKRA